MSQKTVVIVGYGPGVGRAAAEKFGAAGFNVALLARNREKIEAAAISLTQTGIAAVGIPVDASDPLALRGAIGNVRQRFGAISVLFWNAFGVGSAMEWLKEEPASWRNMLDIVVIGLAAAADEVSEDVKAADQGAVLVTTGLSWQSTSERNEQLIGLEKAYPGHGAAVCAVGNAARHRLIGLLREQFKPFGVYVGEVSIAGPVKRTPTADALGYGIDPNDIVESLWKIYQQRSEYYVRVPAAGYSLPDGHSPEWIRAKSSAERVGSDEDLDGPES